MFRGRRSLTLLFFLLLFLLTAAYAAYAWSPLPVVDDPLVRMPGTQPGQVSLEDPNRCLNCHAGYNQSVEPGFNWMGSMMAQSARDFLFWSAMTVAAQDSIWAIGRPNATDLCERCHFPKGWLEGRSDPTNASLMTGADFDGVQCDFCHRLYDPFFEDTHTGTREGSDWLNYWDETNASGTPSGPAADATYAEDATIARSILLFNGKDFFQGDNQPTAPAYTENGGGQYFVSPNADKRASFADAEARHQMLYSRYHKSKYFCNTCHDVSNPALANLSFGGTAPGDGTTVLPSEEQPAYSYYHVERTFSEFMLSAYGQQGGDFGIGPFNPVDFQTSDPDNKIRMCQDCHMRDVVGAGADKRGVPVRPGDSTEHPNSGQPLHDLTGGNIWVSTVLASAIPGSPNYNATNDSLLNRPDALTLDLTQGQGINPEALLAGADRAYQQLQLAAAITDLTYDASKGTLSFHVQNQTGHRLISGFPEGRRMFVNVRAYDSSGLIYEINPYAPAAGTLKGLAHPSSPSLGANEVYSDTLVYEMHPSSSSDLTGETETFHFVLADGRYKDNRIPPKGYDITNAAARQAEPVWHGDSSPGYYTVEEYEGGYDAVALTVPAGADSIEVNLYYQTTSREYIEFLRDEINGTATTLPASAYVAQSDPFFSGLAAWGDTIWQLWTQNMDLPGAAPVLMTQATIGGAPACTATTPTGLTATPGHTQIALSWDPVDGAAGYNLYYDQSGKAQLVAGNLADTSYTDSGLTNGQQYCYKVTSSTTDCESGFSEVVCATPTNQLTATVPTIETGIYSGKGNNASFVVSTSFQVGDDVIIRATVLDGSGQPVEGAVVEITIDGPESVVLTTGHSSASGLAEATWKTAAPKGNQSGTTPGDYSATVSNVTIDGYVWDGVTTSTSFTLQ